MRKRFEIWADSFHEGDWACRELARVAEGFGARHSCTHERGFIPVHVIEAPDWTLELVVYGNYRSWSPLPGPIDELLAWGKPDFVAYDPESQQLVFAVEETAAVPTGNQALQRCERLYGAARTKVPFWYLLSEFGVHKDGGVRRDSIWPTVMALKLSMAWELPVVVLHYSDLSNPEDYTAGTGLASLFGALLDLLISAATGAPHSPELQRMLSEQYGSMMAFIASQAPRQTDFVPGQEHLADPDLAEHVAALVCGREQARDDGSLGEFLVWPTSDGVPDAVRREQVEKPLIKPDRFLTTVERDVGAGRAYCLSSNAGSRPQKAAELESWLGQQRAALDNAPALVPPPEPELDLADFPVSASGLRHVTTSKRILFLYDRWADLRESIESSFPRLAERLSVEPDAQAAMLYVSNSVKPGRIFGDPFTGQIAAFSVAFGLVDEHPRLIVAYFPHQVHAQLARAAGLAANKGVTILRELTDVLIFAGGVVVDPSTGVTL